MKNTLLTIFLLWISSIYAYPNVKIYSLLWNKNPLSVERYFIHSHNSQSVSLLANRLLFSANFQQYTPSTQEQEKQKTSFLLLIISFISIITITLAVIVYRQTKALKLTRNQILSIKSELNTTNQELCEANKIKEDYISFYFTISSLYIDKLENLKQSLNQFISTKRTDDVRNLVINIDIKKEREMLFENFDRTFLKIFPGFIEQYNSLFDPSENMNSKESKTLNTELRIFALIRMGITDTEKIAKMLGLSINTIYTYKTRIKNRAIVSNDEFEQKIMAIRPI